MTESKAISIHDPRTADPDNLPIKTNRYHLNPPLKPIFQKSIIQHQTDKDIVIQPRCDLLWTVTSAVKVRDVRTFQNIATQNGAGSLNGIPCIHRCHVPIELLAHTYSS